MSRNLTLLGVVLFALACGKPSVAPGLDQICNGGPCDAPGVIQGSLVYSGPARGDGILFLFDTQSLPPPDGNATSAVAVARIPAATLFGSAPAGSVGPFSAPYIFTQVLPGKAYQVRAFIDATGDFDPFFDFTQQPRAGDPAGGHGELVNGQPRLVAIPVPAGQVVTGVSVALTQTVPYDPPSFVLTGGSQTLDASIDRPVRLQLSTTRLEVKKASFAAAHFGVELDLDAQGNRRSTAGDGLDDVFPRVFLRQIALRDGTPVAPNDAAIVPCRVNAIPVLPALLVPAAPGAAPLARDTLDLMVEPLALYAGDLSPLPKIPAGTYQVIVVEKTGQVWTLPNQLGDPARAGTGFYAASQSQTVTFSDGHPLPPGSVSGNVVFHGDPSIKSGNIIVQAYAALPFAPPPPLGAAQPVRVQIIRAQSVTKTGDGFTAPYRIDGLPAGNYIVQALDDVDGNFSPLNVLATPTKGDLVGAVIDTTTLMPAVIPVVSGLTGGQDVTLVQRIPLDPPAFLLDNAAATISADAVAPVRFAITAQALAFPLSAAQGTAPHFAVQLVRDAGGAPVDRDGDGLPDVWPRAFLVRLNPDDPTRLTQYLDPATGQTLTEVIPAAVDPTPFLPALKPVAGAPAPPVLTDHLTIVVRPVLLDATAGNAPPRRLPSLVPGAYKLVLVSQTGQVWQVPNEAGSQALDPRVVCAASASTCPPGTVQTQGQSAAFLVTPPVNPIYPGAITGSLSVSGLPASGPGSLVAAYLFAFSASAPPPFGQPVSVDVHYAGEFQAGSVNYALPDLATGKYLITALIDTRGDFSASPAVFALAPGGGDLVVPPQSVNVTTSPMTGINLTAAAAPPITLPPRPSFEFVDGALAPINTDVAVSFGGNPAAKITIQPVATLTTGVAALNPDATAIFLVKATACDGSGKPTALSPTLLLLKVADAAGLVPALDTNNLGTVVPAAIDPAGFATWTCDGILKPVTAAVNVLVQNASVKVDLRSGAVVGSPAALVPGRYQLVLSGATGQVWRVPNELQAGLLDPGALLVAPAPIKALLQTQQVAVVLSP